MNPAFISHDGRVLDFTQPKPSTEIEVKKEEELFHIRAAREAARQSTPTNKEQK
jgi:hypothetical protein